MPFMAHSSHTIGFQHCSEALLSSLPVMSCRMPFAARSPHTIGFSHGSKASLSSFPVMSCRMPFMARSLHTIGFQYQSKAFFSCLPVVPDALHGAQLLGEARVQPRHLMPNHAKREQINYLRESTWITRFGQKKKATHDKIQTINGTHG